MESFTRKKILVSIIFSSIFIAYLSFRLNGINQKLEGGSGTYSYEDRGANNIYLKRCRSVMPIMIKFDPSLNYEEKAAKLVDNTAINSQNICRSSVIDVCMSNSCESMELRLFLIEYFDEQITLTAKDDDRALLKRRIHQFFHNRFVYDLFKNEKYASSWQNYTRLRTLGTMIALAAITETYLELEFESHFLCNENSVNRFWNTLEYLDKEFSDSIDQPARTPREIFIDPFLNSRAAMLPCIKHVFGKNLYNDRLNISRRYYSHEVNDLINYNSIDLNGLINSDYQDISLNLVNWKRNSQYTRSSKIFLLALKQLDYYDQIKIYQKVTGFRNVPDRTGFARLPITRIINGDGEMFPSKFVVVIDPKLSMEELVDKLISY